MREKFLKEPYYHPLPVKLPSREILKKDKKVFLEVEKSGKRRGRDRLFLKSEKPKRENWL